MPRGKSAPKIQREPDQVYKSRVVAKLINMVMQDGKKSIAQKIVYNSIESLSEDSKEARRFFEEAVKNVMPEMEVRSRRVGGANYQVPVPVKHDRAETLAVRWIVDSARSKKGTDFEKRLSDQL